ncbi:hypothetical protein FJZ19_04565 [Candidatus Pacearchaeota archaeon]|nr:hypothetical protein [Candidatus Pacearchaeota archaeon]
MTKINLTKKEINVLTLIDDVPVEMAIKAVKKYIDLENEEIEKIIKKLYNLGLIKKIKIPCGEQDKEWYFHTRLVNKEMINDDLRYKRDRG